MVIGIGVKRIPFISVRADFVLSPGHRPKPIPTYKVRTPSLHLLPTTREFMKAIRENYGRIEVGTKRVNIMGMRPMVR
jgi:hypothetical protein